GLLRLLEVLELASAYDQPRPVGLPCDDEWVVHSPSSDKGDDLNLVALGELAVRVVRTHHHVVVAFDRHLPWLQAQLGEELGDGARRQSLNRLSVDLNLHGQKRTRP